MKVWPQHHWGFDNSHTVFCDQPMTKSSDVNLHYYMACVCSWSNARSDWLTVGHYSPLMPTGRLRACKDRAKQLINLERSIFRVRFYNKIPPNEITVKTASTHCMSRVLVTRTSILLRKLTFTTHISTRCWYQPCNAKRWTLQEDETIISYT